MCGLRWDSSTLRVNSLGAATEIVLPSMTCGTVRATNARCCGEISSSSASVLRVSFHTWLTLSVFSTVVEGLSLLMMEGQSPR